MILVGLSKKSGICHLYPYMWGMGFAHPPHIGVKNGKFVLFGQPHNPYNQVSPLLLRMIRAFPGGGQRLLQ
jgi:hypothetical protein